MGRYRIVGEIAAPRGTGHALAYRREKAIAPDLDKAAVPSVLTMTLPFMLDPRLDEQLENVAELVEAVRALAAAGAREIQFDAPFEAVALVTELRTVYALLPWLTRPFAAVNDAAGAHYAVPGTAEDRGQICRTRRGQISRALTR